MPLVITGVRETISALKKTVTGDTVKVAEGLLRCSRDLLELAQYYVPKDTLALHDSGRVMGQGHGFAARYSVEFGGPVGDVIVDYAHVVHNDLNAYHDPPTQALYLARASVELMPEFAKIMGRQMKTTGQVGIEGVNRSFASGRGHQIPRQFRGMRS